MKDERDKIYDAVKAAEGAAHEVASEHGEGCEFGAMARHVERTMHGLAHQIAPERGCEGPAQVATPAYRQNWEPSSVSR